MNGAFCNSGSERKLSPICQRNLYYLEYTVLVEIVIHPANFPILPLNTEIISFLPSCQLVHVRKDSVKSATNEHFSNTQWVCGHQFVDFRVI